MSHQGRSLSLPEKEMVVHVKNYFDAELILLKKGWRAKPMGRLLWGSQRRNAKWVSISLFCWGKSNFSAFSTSDFIQSVWRANNFFMFMAFLDQVKISRNEVMIPYSSPYNPS